MTNKRESIHGQWSSRWAFILAATGAAVGLGNIWKFPYIMGQNGGGAFVVLYLACILLVATPIFIAEVMLGRRARRSPVQGMSVLAQEESASPAWKYLGWMGVIAGFLILSYYSVIMGWAMAYVERAMTGRFNGLDGAALQSMFESFKANPMELLFWHSLAMLITMLVVVRGVRAGLQAFTVLLMPALLVILLLLVGYGVSTGYFGAAFSYMFTPDFSKLTAHSVVVALGHSFFTLSIGMGLIMAYGSYMPEKVSIGQTALLVVAADTSIALLAGLAIYPVVFANGLEPSAGPGLVFQTLPIAFGHMPLGVLIGTLFFALLTLAAWTSSISMIEPAMAHVVEKRGWTRVKAGIWLGLGAWLLGIASVLSFNHWNEFTLFGKTFFELLDFATSNIMLPLGGLLMAIFATWIMRRESSFDELGMSARAYTLWRILTRYVAPLGIVVIFLYGLGILA
ncbi:MAG: sodium-dependent transporter [Halothiobacillaceae bacterium]|nr:sodium-dependent transporter [Halothiobacillaceae bacterium]